MNKITTILQGGTHVLPVRVYYEDSDAAGIVYYANYLKFAERARTETMRALGFDLQDIKANQGVEFAVRRCHVDYFIPAVIDDLLEVHTKATKVGGASFEFSARVLPVTVRQFPFSRPSSSRYFIRAGMPPTASRSSWT